MRTKRNVLAKKLAIYLRDFEQSISIPDTYKPDFLQAEDSANYQSIYSQIYAFGYLYADPQSPILLAYEYKDIQLRNVYQWADRITQELGLEGTLHLLKQQLHNFRENLSADSLLAFYPHFLHYYQPQNRYKKGVFYTPLPIIDFMISLLNSTLKNDGFEAGLQSPALDFLDLSMGCGLFLDRLHKLIPRSAPHLKGIEISFVPYLICRLHMNYLMANADIVYENAFNDSTLTAKVILGNPPYGAYTPSQNAKQLLRFAYPEYNFDINGKEISYRAETQAGKPPLARKNKGKLRDLYAYFWGLACHKIKPGGFICLITSNSFLSLPSYTYLRKYLLKNFRVEYVINFNTVSQRKHSMFAPHAAISTSIVLLTASPSKIGHKIAYLDLSDCSLKEKWQTLADVTWNPESTSFDHEQISSYRLREIDELPWQHYQQESFLAQPEYSFLPPLQGIFQDAVKLSTLAIPYQGVDIGDLRYLCATCPNKLTKQIKSILQGDIPVDMYGNIRQKLQKKHATQQFQRFSCEKIKAFTKQKDIHKWQSKSHHYVYMDNDLLWRSRLTNHAVLQPYKLLIREIREPSPQLLASVCSKGCIPQHGGRFFYLTTSESLSIDDLYVLAALLNSSVVQHHYQKVLPGVKDCYLPDLRTLKSSTYDQLLELSQRAHQSPNNSLIDEQIDAIVSSCVRLKI